MIHYLNCETIEQMSVAQAYNQAPSQRFGNGDMDDNLTG